MTTTFLTSQPVSAEDATKPHIILVGLPGAGKSTVGPALAERLERVYLDFDREIEQREGMSVSEIFAGQGEAYFRRQERDLTREVQTVGNMVLAPGGGWITNQAAVKLLRPPGRIFYLQVSPQAALERMGTERAARPLLHRPDPLAELNRLYEAREPLYRMADFFVDTELIDLQQIIDLLAQVAESFEEA